MNNSKNILIGILVILVIGLSSYIVYDKVMVNNNDNNGQNELENENNNSDESETDKENSDNNNDKKDEVIELSLEDEFVKKAFGIHSYFIYGSDLVDYFYKNDKMIFMDLPKDWIANIFIWDWLNDIPESSRDDSYVYYDSKTILNEWKKFAGSNNEFNLYDYGADIYGYKFSSDGSFKRCAACDGGVGPGETENTLLRATKTDDEIILYEVVKFMKFAENSDEAFWYKDYNKTIRITENETIDANYKFIYKKDINDNYYFYGVEKIK